MCLLCNGSYTTVGAKPTCEPRPTINGGGEAALDHTAAPANLDEFGPVVIRQGIHAFAAFLQYILSVIFLATGVMSLVRRSPSIALFDDVLAGPTVNVVALSW